jgi:hypothetical protein
MNSASEELFLSFGTENPGSSISRHKISRKFANVVSRSFAEIMDEFSPNYKIKFPELVSQKFRDQP